MSSAARIKPSLSKLKYADINTSEFYAELNSDNDRACILVGAAALDHAMQRALSHKFTYANKEELDRLFFSPNGPLASFSNRILVSFALGLISPAERKDLDTVRHIRNALAHSPLTIKFSDEIVAVECKKLSVFNQLQAIVGFVPNDYNVQSTDPKQVYIQTILYFYIKMQDVQTTLLSSTVTSLKIERIKLKFTAFVIRLVIPLVRFRTACFRLIARVRHFVIPTV